MALRGTNKRVLVDFDGVLRAKDANGVPIHGASSAIRALKKLGYEIVVFSTRAAPSEAWNVDSSINYMKKWLAENDIDYDGITGETHWRHGRYSAEAKAERRHLRQLMRKTGVLMEKMIDAKIH